MFLTKKCWPIKSVIIITTQPIVLLLGCGSYFGVYFLSTIINLRKRQVLLRKPTFSEKAILSDKKTWQLSPFLGKFKVPLFHTRSRLNIRYDPFNKVEK